MSSLAQNNAKPALKDRLIPWYFVLMFLIVFAVNGVFVYVAVNSNSGVVTENAYEKGLNYNQTIDLAKAQEALGWVGGIQYGNGLLSFHLRDKEQVPLSGAKVVAYISRPIESGYESEVILPETAVGVYIEKISFPQKGQWDIIVEAIWKNQHYQIRKRLVVK